MKSIYVTQEELNKYVKERMKIYTERAAMGILLILMIVFVCETLALSDKIIQGVDLNILKNRISNFMLYSTIFAGSSVILIFIYFVALITEGEPEYES